MSTYSNLKFELITTGEQSGQWGNTTNTNIGTAIEQAIVGMATLTSADFSSNVATLVLADVNTAQNARALCLNIAAGAVSAAGTINVPAIQKPYLIINGSSFAVTVKVSGQTGVSVPAGRRTVVYNNATDVGNQIDYLANLTLGTALPIASGGTGTTSTTFVNLATNVTGTLPVLSGGTGVTTSTGTGSVVLSTSPTLVTPALGTPASGNFSTGTFTWPTFNQNTTGTAGGLSSTLAVASGGTGVTTSTGSGSVVLSTSPTLVTPALGTPSSGTLTNCTFPTLNQNTTGTAAGLSLTLAVASGGTGLTSTPANGQIDIGNGSGFTRTTLTAGSNITITNSAGGISIAAANSGGTVTGVTATAPVTSTGGTAPIIGMPVASASANGYLSSTDWTTFNNKGSGNGTVTSVTGTSPIASTGGTTPAISISQASGSTNGFLSSTDWTTFNGKLSSGGALGTPSSGNLTNCTFPTLNQNTTGTAAGLSSILAVASGGTGTATPSLVAGTNVTISGTWPNQTVNATLGGSYTTNGIAYADSTTTLATGTALTFNGTLMTLGTPALAKRFSIGGDTLTNTTFSIESTTSTSVAPIIQLHRSNSTLNNLQTVGSLSFTRLLSDTTQVTAAQIFVTGSNNSASQAASMFLESYTDFKFRLYNTGSTVEKMRLDVNGYLLVNYTSSNGAYPLQVNGQIFATSSTIATSDARYKENVTTLDGALDVVKALRPVQFNWKQHATHNFDTQTPTIGFLAQEVQQVLADKPYLNSVIKSSDCVTQEEELNDAGDIVKEKITEEFLGIAESNLIAILTKAMQEQQAQIEALTARLNAANL
jgi:hypothetical protein